MTEPIPETGDAEPLSEQHAASAPSENLWQRVKEHKVLQWSLTYLGAALAVAHGQELLSHTYHWPELVGRLLIGVLIVGFPIAVALAWYHGHKGLKQITAGEMTVVSILILIGAGLLIVLVRAPAESVAHQPVHESRPPVPAPVSARKPRLAILPFENLSPDPANAFFTDGLHEEILATLAQRAPGLEVISRTTMMMYRLKPEPVAEVARELGATHVLEGSVRRDGQQVRLTLQLIDARTDDHLWAQNYDRTLTHALTLQSEVANEVASQLFVQLSGGKNAKPPTRDPEAYDFYLKALLGRGAALVARTIDPLKEVEEFLSAAIARDPLFAAAYAERFPVRMSEFFTSTDTNEDALRGATEDLEAAERLAPGDPIVLAARAVYLGDIDHDDEGAVAAYTTAEAAGLADPMWIVSKAISFIRLGRCDDGIRVYERTLPLDPRNPFIITRFAEALTACHRPAETLRLVDSASRQLPDIAAFRGWRAYVVFAFTGNLDGLNSLPVGSGPNIEWGSTDWEFDRLRWTHRYPELQRQLARVGAPILPAPGLGEGAQPIARYRGWTHMLLGDRAEAARDGVAVLDFVAQRKETPWNRVFLRQLTAEGYTFTGDSKRAVAAARNSLELSRPSRALNASLKTDGLRVAAVFAWNGAENAAVQLLEQLATTIPGPGPAEITRDPLYTIPLAHNVGFQRLVVRLEAQMRKTKQQ